MKEISYQAGGPLLSSSPVYVMRRADYKAAAHLRRMDYITLIEPRQQGKTSLINQLNGQYSKLGFLFAYRDLMVDRSRAASLTEWYNSLGRRLKPQLRSILQDHQLALPTDSSSWEDFLAEVAACAEKSDRRVVIVLDEVGALPTAWATDFFSVVRSVYTSRQSLSYWEHLTFIIAGAFNPKELIQDNTVSNFNIDQRIRLEDFTQAEVGQLVAHLQLPADLASEVTSRLYGWTSGQPYLCQRLCRYLAELAQPISPPMVDRVVDQFFQEDTHHLARIKELVEDSDLLSYCQRITCGARPRLTAALNENHFRLAHILGVIKADEDGLCQIRNRICERALSEISREQRAGGKQMIELAPDIRAQGALFLFEIGRWAAAELKERWTLTRQKKETNESAEVDLSKPKEEVEQATDELLQTAAEECGPVEVERVLALIKRKRNLVLEWKEIQVDNEEEYSRGRIDRSMLRLKQQDLDGKITQCLNSIEADLRELGVSVRREKAVPEVG